MKKIFTKSFEQEFLKMLDERGIQDPVRSSLLELPLDRQETLLENFKRERKKKSLWRRISFQNLKELPDPPRRRDSMTLNDWTPEQVNYEFLKLIAKLQHPDSIKERLMGYDLEQRRDCLCRYHIQGSDIMKNPFQLSNDLSEKYVDMQLGHLLKQLNASPETVEKVHSMTMNQKMDYINQYSRQSISSSSSDRNSRSSSQGNRKIGRTMSLQSLPLSSMQQQMPLQSSMQQQKPTRHMSQLPEGYRPEPLTRYHPDQYTTHFNYGGSVTSSDNQPNQRPIRPALKRMQSDIPISQKALKMIPRALSMHFKPTQQQQPVMPKNDRHSMPTGPRPQISKRSSSMILNEIAKENSPAWFIAQISNRNTSLKALSRHIHTLETIISLSGKDFVIDFVKTVVDHVGVNGLNGIASLEIALDRVCIPHQTKQSYADSVVPDEVRIHIVKCIQLIIKTDIGMEHVFKSRGLIRQLIWCLCVPSTQLQQEMNDNISMRSTYLSVRTLVCEVFGPACLLDEVLAESVISIIKEIQKYQNEPLPFFYLIASMNNPFTFHRSATAVESNNSLDYLAEYSDIWDYRSQLFLLFNGLVSSSESISERIRIRRMLESCGLVGIVKSLLNRNPSQEFLNQSKSYDQDRENDIKEQEKKYHAKNINMESSNVLFENLIGSLQKLPDPEMAQHFVMSTIAHMNDIVNGLQKNMGSDNELGSRNDISSILALLERSTHSVAESVGNWQYMSKTEQSQKMDHLQMNFYESVERSMNEFNVTQKGASLRQVVQELNEVREKHRQSKALAETYRKQLDHLRSTIDTQSSVNRQIDNSFGLYPVKTESLMETIPKELLEPQGTKSPDWDIRPPEALEKLGRAAGIGMLWLEIQRLEDLVARLQEKKKEDSQLEKVPVPVPVVLPPPPPPPPAPPIPHPPPVPPVPNAPIVAPVLKPAGPKPVDVVLKSQIAMKPLQWEKIPKHVANHTIWKDLFENAYELNVLNEPELIDLFQKAELKQTESTKIESKPEIVRFLNQKVAQNLEILLNSFKCSYEQIRDALFVIYDDMLTLDRISSLKPLIPDSDVMESILTYQGPIELLGVAEQFIKCIYDVPRIKPRLESMIYRLRYYQDIQEVQPDLKSLLCAIKQLKESKQFQTLLKVILVIGNYLNGNSFRGNAIGFKIDSLLSIKDTKPAGGQAKYYPTLLHYVAKCLRDQYPETLDFMNEIPDTIIASKISVTSLVDGVKELVQGFQSLESEIVQVERIGCLENDSFLEIFTLFREKAKSNIEHIDKDVLVLQDQLVELFEFFGEDVGERKKEPRKFFETIVQFSIMLQNAHRDNVGLQEKRWRSMQLIQFADLSQHPSLLDYMNKETKETSENVLGFESEQPDNEDDSFLEEDAFYDEDTITPFDPDVTIQAHDYPQADALELTAFLVRGGITMQETRDTLKRIKKHRTRELSVEQDLDGFSSRLNSLQVQEEEQLAEPGEIVKRNSI